MKTAFYIARRYFFSRKTQNVINVISGISVFGITISTAALVIVLSAFNGIEGLVLSMFSEFDADLEITVKEGKTFDQRIFDASTIESVEHVTSIYPVIDEIIILKNDEKWVNARVLGVSDVFLERVNMHDHLKDGQSTLTDKYGALMLSGAGVLHKLSAHISYLDGSPNEVIMFAPKRNTVYKPNTIDQPFNQVPVRLGAVFSYNKDVDLNYCILPIETVSKALEYGNDVTRFEVDVDEDEHIETVKAEIEKKLPSNFKVSTRLEKNDLIYKTSRTEKWITVFILGFIFLLASFNMIASLTMLMLEKRKDIHVLLALGATNGQIRNIFFFEGILINCIGGIVGLLLGYGICFAQLQWGLITMNGGIVDVYPVAFTLFDFSLIVTLIFVVGSISSYLPVRFLKVKTVRL